MASSSATGVSSRSSPTRWGCTRPGLFRQLTGRLTVVLHGPVDVDDSELDALRASGVDVRYGPVSRIVARRRRPSRRRSSWPTTNASTPTPSWSVPASRCAPNRSRRSASNQWPHPSGLGDFVETDATGATVVPGLYAAGNVTDPSQQVLQAAANGSRVGAMISFSLADDDIRAAARPSANEADWDHRYGDDQMWSGNPNGTLVNEISGITPGRALDVGAGEGGDALWLAEQGWSVTASDISQRGAGPGRRRGQASRATTSSCHHADANALDAFETAAFDLVSAQYASIPRTPDGRGIRNLLNAVAPGRHAARREPRSRADACAGRCPGPQPAVRPGRLPPDRRLRGRARRLISMGHRGPREATSSGRGPPPLHTTSTMSCCGPAAAPADESRQMLSG